MKPRRGQLRPVAARRGTVLVTAIWVTLVLGAAVLVYARSMRVELIAAANRLAAEQASAVERGAEQYVLAHVEAGAGDARAITSAPAEAVRVGGGYFWVLRPDPADARRYDYGIADEAAKLNLNTTPPDRLALLPGMTEAIAGAVADWRDPDSEVGERGAEKDFYLSLPDPYNPKNGPLETVEELRLLKGVTDGILRGYDRNFDGVVGAAEQAGERAVAMFNSASGARGVFPFATVMTVEPNTDADGQPRVNVNTIRGNPPPGIPGGPPGGPVSVPVPTPARAMAAPPAPGGAPVPTPGSPGAPGGDGSEALREALQKELPANRVDEILARARAAPGYASVLDFAAKAGVSSSELRKVIDRLTWTDGKVLPGLVNVNTAPREVLRCVPGLDEGDVNALLARRGGSDGADLSWVLDALPPEKAGPAGAHLTGRSFQYSADIVAVSGDGRAFKRIRIVVDGRGKVPVIVRRKDLTSLGWPLPRDVRDTLRAGRDLPTRARQARPQGS